MIKVRSLDIHNIFNHCNAYSAPTGYFIFHIERHVFFHHTCFKCAVIFNGYG